METMFNVLSEIKNEVEFSSRVKTNHWSNDRIDRHNMIMQFIGDGKYMTSFIVDKGHRNGPEIHNIYDNGIVVIENYATRRMITELIARPQQIRRYFEGLGRVMDSRYNNLIRKCSEHQRLGYNNL